MLPVNSYEYPETQPSWDNNFPHVTIVEHPWHLLRFRYECERRCAGRIVGEHSKSERKTFPTIRVHGYKGPAVIVVSCVTRNDPPRPHPHSVMGKNSTVNGIYTLKVNIDDGLVPFSNLGIQCMKRKQVTNALEIRQRERIDPFGTGFDHIDFPDSIDLNSIRLCFQVFIRDAQNKIARPLKPVVTNPIYDKKAKEDLIICKLSSCTAPVSGGTEIILLCGKVSRDDVEIRFFEMRNEWLFWEAMGDFHPVNVHKQVAIVFKTPAYCRQDVDGPVAVQIQLRKKTDGSVSKPLPFLMLPVDLEDADMLKRKRARLECNPRSLMLKQMQIEFEKRNAKLKFPDPGNVFENNNYSQHDLNVRTPVPQPRVSLAETEKLPKKVKERKPRLPRKRITPQVGIEKINSMNDSEGPQPLPRRRLETPPPNVTIHSFDYRENLMPRQWQELERYPQFSQQQPTVMNPPFTVVNNLPSCDFEPRRHGPRVLPEIEPRTRNVDNFDATCVPHNLSKGLSLSDIQNTFQNIRDLNRNLEENQQRISGMFGRNQGIDNQVNAHNWNGINGHGYENVPDENHFFP